MGFAGCLPGGIRYRQSGIVGDDQQVAESIEREIKKPVITANQAMIWQALRISGYKMPVEGFGTILTQ